jgi:hypothetical protein
LKKGKVAPPIPSTGPLTWRQGFELSLIVDPDELVIFRHLQRSKPRRFAADPVCVALYEVLENVQTTPLSHAIPSEVDGEFAFGVGFRLFFLFSVPVIVMKIICPNSFSFWLFPCSCSSLDIRSRPKHVASEVDP